MSNNIRFPNTLVISFNCFSKNGSNGRVLGELFSGWDKSSLAQLFIENQDPNAYICKNYYRITDKDALKAFMCGGKVGKRISIAEAGTQQSIQYNSSPRRKKIPKNPLTALLRDLVWRSERWKSKDLWKWIDNFNPDVVLVQVGGGAFLPRIARTIAQQKGLPIVIYNTENYYFKDFNYFFNARFGWLYPLYRKEFHTEFDRLMAESICEIYTNEELQELYNSKFNKKGILIYQSTMLKEFDSVPNQPAQRFCYTGNLGLDRHVSLIEISRALKKISNEFYLDIYGNSPNVEVENALRNEVGIYYHGGVSYKTVLSVMEKSDILFHAESFQPDRVTDLVTAFSTKIADSLASGRCLVVYADKTIAISKYLIRNDCACVITCKDQLENRLREVIYSQEIREHYIQNAIKIAHCNHDSIVNREKFVELIIKVAGDRNEDLSN